MLANDFTRYTHFQMCMSASPSADIIVGYSVANVTALESDGMATLTVVVTTPIETSFFLLVNTLDGAATGLPWRLEFDYVPIHSVTNRSLTPVYIMLTHAHTNSHSVHL